MDVNNSSLKVAILFQQLKGKSGGPVCQKEKEKSHESFGLWFCLSKVIPCATVSQPKVLLQIF
jgi:hypothetical protein